MEIWNIVNQLVDGIEKPYDKARRINDWLFKEFEWTATDYQKRTVEEIIERKGGNCAEQTMVFAAALTSINIPSRWVLEVNSHPESLERQKNAEELIQSVGYKASLFGFMHNDHRFLEFYDEKSQQWVPADSSFGVFGMEEWITKRLGFSRDSIPSQESIIPLFIAVLDDEKHIEMISNEAYLRTAFSRYSYIPLHDLDAWYEHLEKLQDLFANAYNAKINMHTHTDKINAAVQAFKQLQEKSSSDGVAVIGKIPSL
jgi:hypothetical protein